MMRHLLLLLIIFISWSVQTQQLPPGFVLEKVAEGLNPTTFTFGPLDRIYIADKSGKVWVIDENDELLSEPLINIEVDDFDERGLGGLAFHPRFEEFPFVYLYYTVKGANHNRLSRFQINGDRAIPGTEEILIDFNLVNGFIHNAGRLVFDSEEHLFISTGDGAEQWNAQSLDNLLGKILRINPDGSIPSDNPFYNEAEGINRAIWSYGLRNSFSMDIHASTNELFAGEVGLGTWEEINQILPGQNYGWPFIEGFRQNQSEPENYQEPRYTYHHSNGCAIIGVSIMDQMTNYPEEYHNAVFFADYCNGYINHLDQHTDHSHEFATGFELPVDLQVGPDGNLYVITRKGKGQNSTQDNTRVEDGILWRIRYQGDGPPRIAIEPSTPKLASGENMLLEVTAFGTPPLIYSWYQDDELIQETTQAGIQIANPSALSQYYCVVENQFGQDTSLMVSPDIIEGARPIGYIIQPIQDAYKGGDTIYFRGYGIDTEDDTLSNDQLSWSVNFHHNTHYHPSIGPISGIDQGQLITPTTAETDTQVWYRVNLTVTDSDGLSETTFHDLYPIKHRLSFAGPKDVPLNIDGIQLPLPGRLSTVSGVVRTIQAPISHQVHDSLYVFSRWMNGTTSNLLVKRFLSDTSFEAIYERIPLGNGTGLLGHYYPGIQIAPTGEGVTRLDSIIDFVWENSPYWPDIPDDRFTIVWSGDLEPLVDGEYTIKSFTDDGVRVWIGNTLLIDAWESRRSTQDIAYINLQAGRKYPIVVQYFEDLSQAVAQLHWSHSYIPSEIIPAKQLYPREYEVPGKVRVTAFFDVNQNQIRDANEPLLDAGQLLLTSDQDTMNIELSGLPFETWVQPGLVSLSLDEDQFFLEPAADYRTNLVNQQLISGDSVNWEIPFVFKENTLQGVSWTVKPNPIEQSLKLYYQNKLPSQAKISLSTVQGSLIFQENVFLENTYGIIEKPVHDLPAGTYLFTIEVGGVSETIQIVKR